MAEEKVYDFMKSHNRPFSVSDIHKNLGDLPKSEIQSALDSLGKNDKMLEKTYGKLKVYCVRQEADVAGNIDDELKAMDRRINNLKSNLEEVNKKLQAEAKQLQERKSKMSLEEAASRKVELEQQIVELKEELKSFEESSTPISESERVKICEEYHKYEKEYRWRKKICRDIVNQIMENYPKSEKVLLEEVGVETDEDVGFKYEPILK